MKVMKNAFFAVMSTVILISGLCNVFLFLDTNSTVGGAITSAPGDTTMGYMYAVGFGFVSAYVEIALGIFGIVYMSDKSKMNIASVLGAVPVVLLLMSSMLYNAYFDAPDKFPPSLETPFIIFIVFTGLVVPLFYVAASFIFKKDKSIE